MSRGSSKFNGSPEHLEICRKGGIAAQKNGPGNRWTAEEARAMALRSKGGVPFTTETARAAGKRSAEMRAERKRQQVLTFQEGEQCSPTSTT